MSGIPSGTGIRWLNEMLEARSLSDISDCVIDKVAELPIELSLKKELAVYVGALTGVCRVHDADALVRCKDCKYWGNDEETCLDEIGYGRKWMATDFCSHAEHT